MKEQTITIELTKDELLILRNATTELAIETYNSIEMLQQETIMENEITGYYKTKRRKERLLDKYNLLALKLQNIIDTNN